MSAVAERQKQAAYLLREFGPVTCGLRDYWMDPSVPAEQMRAPRYLSLAIGGGDTLATSWYRDGNVSALIAGLLQAAEDILWAQYGYNVFDLTSSLCAALSLTEPSSENGFPRLPFPSCVLRVPDNVLPLFYADGTLRWANHLWCSSITGTPWWEPGKRGFAQASSWPGVRFTITASIGFGNECTGFSVTDDDFHSVCHFLRDQLDEDYTLVGNGPAIIRQSTTRHAAMHLLANFCSWLESIGGMRKLGPRPHNARPSDSALADRIAQWIVGRDVKLSPELRAAAGEQAKHDRRKSAFGWRIKSRFVVRGHMRNQACGVGHLERRKMWISPYWKGAGGQQWSHVYKATATKSAPARETGEEA